MQLLLIFLHHPPFSKRYARLNFWNFKLTTSSRAILAIEGLDRGARNNNAQEMQ
jgi:hypothetical protein